MFTIVLRTDILCGDKEVYNSRLSQLHQKPWRNSGAYRSNTITAWHENRTQ